MGAGRRTLANEGGEVRWGSGGEVAGKLTPDQALEAVRVIGTTMD